MRRMPLTAARFHMALLIRMSVAVAQTITRRIRRMGVAPIGVAYKWRISCTST